MPVTVIIEGATADRVQVRLSRLSELGAALHVLAVPQHHGAHGADWAAAARDALTAQQLRAAEHWSPLWSALRARFLFPLDAAGDRSLDDELAAIAELPVGSFTSMVVEAVIDRDRAMPYSLVIEDPDAGRRFVDHAGRFSPQHAELAAELISDPEQCRRRLLEFLAEFDRRAFAAEWRRTVPALHREAERLLYELARDGLGAIGSVSDTATELPEPRRIVFDKLYDGVGTVGRQPLLMVPSLQVGPHIVIKHAPASPLIIQYAAGNHRLPPYEEINRRIRALSDPGRIRLARALLRGRRTTVDLAHYTGMSEPQVSRHLRRLREAELVCTSREGALVFYSLDTEVISRIGADLLSTLWR
ncbi:ArsR/SmtB family transcription factor [Microlunatus soli]|uniref:DNA-binding transcriptional regulator, ArsR family n=1 Tax=Microlunatus soli TaxID=630515 RepID=A0A1H1PCZ1_9ACTN|nr:DUF5937 family protein [Microlunatus soli]SDS08875.1 DNA-binding transcriptional regulator, ArsR family [Microlunatus soli]